MITGLLNQTCPKIFSITTDGYGDVATTLVYSNIKCRWQESTKETTLPDNQIVSYNAQMWLKPDIKVEEGYRVSMNNKTYVITNINKLYDIDGIHRHTKVYLE